MDIIKWGLESQGFDLKNALSIWYLILKSKLCYLHIRSGCILMNMVMKCTYEKKIRADDELLYNFCTEMYSDDLSDKQRSYRDLSV